MKQIDFLLTGTRVYGPASNESDIDIVTHIEDIEEIKQELDHYNISWKINDSNYENASLYFTFMGIMFNIIIATQEEYAHWMIATEKMKRHVFIHGPIKSHEDRVRIFQSYFI